MCHQTLTFVICTLGVILSARVFKNELEYFGKVIVDWQLVFVPSLCVGVIQIVMIGFTLNLYCYHRWLKRHGITTLEHIFKFNSSKNLNKVVPKLKHQVMPEASRSQRETERVKIKSKQAEMSSARGFSSKGEIEERHQMEEHIRSQKSAVSEGFSLGKPKSNLKMAQEYIRNSKIKYGTKNGSLKEVPINSKKDIDLEFFKKQRNDPALDTIPKSIAKSPLDPPLLGKNDNPKDTNIRKMSKRRLAPLPMP